MPSPRFSRLIALAVGLLAVPAAPAQTFTWLGTSSANWSDGTNWTPPGPPPNGSTVVFDATSTGNLTNTNDLTGLALAAVQFTATPSAVTVNGNQITLTGASGLALTGVSATVNTPLALGVTQSWSVADTFTLTVGGVISGPSTVTLATTSTGNGGNTVLNAQNTYLGPTTAGRGNLRMGVDNALPATTVVSVGGAAGQTAQLVLNGTSQTIAGLDTVGGGTRRVIGNSATQSVLTFNVAAGQSFDYSSQFGQVNQATTAVQNNIAVIKTGPGLQELTNNTVATVAGGNSSLRYSGTTTIQGGALGFEFQPFLSGAVDPLNPVASYMILDGGVVQTNAGTALTFSRNLSATPAGNNFQFTANGGGFSAQGAVFTVNIGGAAATIDWGTTVGTNLVGTLKFGHETANNQTTLVNGLNLNGAVRTIDAADNPGNAADFASITGTIADGSGSGGLIKTGNGMLELAPTTTNTYTGTTTVSGGTLSATKTSALPGYNAPSQVAVQGGATLQVRTGNAAAGEWTAADVTTLFANATFATGSNFGLDVSTGSTVDFSTFPALRTDMGLQKFGAGTLVIPNSQTYTAGTTLLGGLLQIGQNDSLGTGPLLLGGGALSSTDTTARSIANATTIPANVTLGDATNNGALTFTQVVSADPVNNRVVTVVSPVTFAAGLNASIVKAGAGRLTLQGTSSFPASGPPLVVNAGELFIDSGASVTLNGNTAVRVFSNVAGATATLTVAAGGTLTQNTTTGNLRVGFEGQNATGSATVSIAGTYQATAFTTGGQVILDDEGVTNTLNLQPGGLIVARQINRDSSANGTAQSIFNIDGGTIRAVQSNTAFIGSTTPANALTQVNIQAGGLTIDSNGFNVTVPQPLLAPAAGASGGLTKVGAGTLVLTGANTYTGPTTVTGGALGGTGSIAGPVTVAAGGAVSPGASIGTLTVGTGVAGGPAMTWLPGGGYVFEHKADPTQFVGGPTTPTAGTDNDLVTTTGGGTLDLSGLSASNPFVFTLLPTALPATNPGTVVTYTVATFPGGVTPIGPADQTKFAFQGAWDPAFGNPVVSASGGVLTLSFAPVPEPGFVLLACGAVAGGLRWVKRRRGREASITAGR